MAGNGDQSLVGSPHRFGDSGRSYLGHCSIHYASKLVDRDRFLICDKSSSDIRSELFPVRKNLIGTKPGGRRRKPDGRQCSADIFNGDALVEAVDHRPIFGPLQIVEKEIVEEVARDRRLSTSACSDD